MKYLAKNGKQLNVVINEDRFNRFFSVSIEEDDIMGSATFKIYDSKKTTWLFKIETKKEYQHMGIGQALIDIVEYISCLNHMQRIEGRYFPDNEHAKPFYKKNNYEIYKEGYDSFILKNLDRKHIFTDIEPRIKDYIPLPPEM